MTNSELSALFENKILLLDGAMGTMVQSFNLTEDDFRGERFKNYHIALKGNNDILPLVRPDVIESIHRQYLDNGADIISTDSFNANAISMADYGMADLVAEINNTSAKLARKVADNFMVEHPDRKVFVAGSIGPTNKTASMSPDVNDPSFRDVSFDDLYNAYRIQIAALFDGGIDILLFETIFDSLNLKAALSAAEDLIDEYSNDMAIMLSLTLSGKGGRTFSGQTFKAFLASISHAKHIVSVGLNCSFGARDMYPYLKELSEIAPYFISAYPNAGLPDTFGNYSETPESFAEAMSDFVKDGLVNAIGGCCGTTPAHINAISNIRSLGKPHIKAKANNVLALSGLDVLEISPAINFVNIGERCNVAGSRKFLRLIKEGSYDEALSIARKQVDDGAQMLDINMDDGMLDAVAEMRKFLNLLASDPDIARAPIMIDSSKWDVIITGLKCCQGKSIVNSISLKEGEDVFLNHARAIQRLGAAVIVMAFDEKGQADTFERKIEVCERAYNLLRDKLNFNPNDIIFDPNVLAIATGVDEHNAYADNFIKATKWIKDNLPHAKVSGGVSNLSFSFRGNNYLREAMHAVFLYHAIANGMDMAIVNPGTSVQYDDIDPDFRSIIEDAILNRRPDACSRLIEYAQQLHAPEATDNTVESAPKWRQFPVQERLQYALEKGVNDFLAQDIAEALTIYSKPVDIIDGPLMNGMKHVGDLFGEGKMFLPQVVKTARTMKKAVAELQPALIEAQNSEHSTKSGKIILATVKGDVHDIGKNIVGIIMSCNNYDVIDLGVMVDADTIVKATIENNADLIGLSGLITPSLDEMVHIVEALNRANITVPVLIGGATTSKIHTAVKIAPHYNGVVVHVGDASQNPIAAANLLNAITRDKFIADIQKEYSDLRQSFSQNKNSLSSLSFARKHTAKINWDEYSPIQPKQLGRKCINLNLSDVISHINWAFFFNTWKLDIKFAAIAFLHECAGCQQSWLNSFSGSDREKAEQSAKLFNDAKSVLSDIMNIAPNCCHAIINLAEANSNGDNILISDISLALLRQQGNNDENIFYSLADFVAPKTSNKVDYMGAFAISISNDINILKKSYDEQNDSYKVVLLQTICDRLAEAASEYLHLLVRKDYWGYDPNENLSLKELFSSKYVGIRPAVGYPSLPDQRIIFQLDKLLNLSEIGISLTENGAMLPTSSVCGLYFANHYAKYFAIGKIDNDQLADYASRTKTDTNQIRKYLSKNIQ
jgi:5-methyltetrahydrofolate--homocysteine methyltransferase